MTPPFFKKTVIAVAIVYMWLLQSDPWHSCYGAEHYVVAILSFFFAFFFLRIDRFVATSKCIYLYVSFSTA